MIIHWLIILILGVGALFFIYDNIIFFIGFKTWVPDRALNLTVAVSMLTGSVVTLFNLFWFIINTVLRRPLLPLMRPILALSGSINLLFTLFVFSLISWSLYQVSGPDCATVIPAALLFGLFGFAIIIMVIHLWKSAFSRWGI